MELTGKVGLITGASSGIGEALARQMAAEGALVALIARRGAELERLVAEIGPDRAVACPGDVTVPDDARRAVETAIERFGQLDILINNAGVLIAGAATDIPLDVAERGFRINVFGPLVMTQQAVKHLTAPGGLVVNVSSGSSMRPSVSAPLYSMSKAAMNLFSASLREELKDRGIRVMTVHPGLINNQFPDHALSSAELAERRKNQPSQNSTSERTSTDAARDILDAIRRDEAVLRVGGHATEMPL